MHNFAAIDIPILLHVKCVFPMEEGFRVQGEQKRKKCIFRDYAALV